MVKFLAVVLIIALFVKNPILAIIVAALVVAGAAWLSKVNEEEKGGGERMSAEERLKSAGFKKIKNGNGDDCCLFCNYYHLSNDKSEASCTLYGVRFLGDFEASEHICNRFDGSELSSLMKAAVEEYSKPERSADQKQNAQASRK